jgi:hypothetical protein
LANGARAEIIARARELLAVAAAEVETDDPATTDPAPKALACPCPYCGGGMIIIETSEAGTMPRPRPSTPCTAIRIDTS